VDVSQDTAFITVTERTEHALGKTMEVDSTSPDTGQQGGCTRASNQSPMHCRGRR
jgi:hypothetical protein